MSLFTFRLLTSSDGENWAATEESTGDGGGLDATDFAVRTLEALAPHYDDDLALRIQVWPGTTAGLSTDAEVDMDFSERLRDHTYLLDRLRAGRRAVDTADRKVHSLEAETEQARADRARQRSAYAREVYDIYRTGLAQRKVADACGHQRNWVRITVSTVEAALKDGTAVPVPPEGVGPVLRACAALTDTTVHMAVYRWSEEADQWSGHLSLCGGQHQDAPLPVSVAATCVTCLELVDLLAPLLAREVPGVRVDWA